MFIFLNIYQEDDNDSTVNGSTEVRADKKESESKSESDEDNEENEATDLVIYNFLLIII